MGLGGGRGNRGEGREGKAELQNAKSDGRRKKGVERDGIRD